MIAEARLDKAVAYFKELRDRHPYGGGLALELAAAAYQIPRPRLSAALADRRRAKRDARPAWDPASAWWNN